MVHEDITLDDDIQIAVTKGIMGGKCKDDGGPFTGAYVDLRNAMIRNWITETVEDVYVSGNIRPVYRNTLC